jgi:hypothetical protein
VHPPAGYELHFFVRYTLGEYIGFMWQHGGYLIRRRHIRWPVGLYLRLKSTPVGGPALRAARARAPHLRIHRSTSTASCAPAAPA